MTDIIININSVEASMIQDGVAANILTDQITSTIVGVPGPQGISGQGVPTGGTTGQLLAKTDAVDYNTEWIGLDTDDISEGGTNLYSQWANITGGISYTGGNVGIGTSVPAYPLDIFKFQNADTIMRLRNTSSGTSARALFYLSNNVANAFYLLTSSTYVAVTNWQNTALMGADSGITGGYALYSQNKIRMSNIATADDFLLVGNKVGIGRVTPTALCDLAGSSTARASLRIRSGTAPTSPNEGDIWFDGTDLKAYIGGTTKTFTLT